ncbi:cytochrome b5-like heme/steroid binding domain-containing protein [Dactylonectria macrodidyma]|uniref:Cytochrome b5-like heme/steroid binding domain-containing protein n=1 Tax=Dactylonectria macrodidyma TaxID=307937 RepID=A0A9P9EYY8_9HYPO|nr:cytochrome b5-like heme/steroid binding domain-containing protein [Dactylonectria macrodidyma]
MSEQYTIAEVGKHKSADDGFWLVVESNVYDVTKFMDEHPGGAKIIKRWAGKDATKPFWKYHNEDVLKKYGANLKIGAVGEKAKL